MILRCAIYTSPPVNAFYLRLDLTTFQYTLLFAAPTEVPPFIMIDPRPGQPGLIMLDSQAPGYPPNTPVLFTVDMSATATVPPARTAVAVIANCTGGIASLVVNPVSGWMVATCASAEALPVKAAAIAWTGSVVIQLITTVDCPYIVNQLLLDNGMVVFVCYH